MNKNNFTSTLKPLSLNHRNTERYAVFFLHGIPNRILTRLFCNIVRMLHFFEDFFLRLKDLMEPNILFPRSLSERERWRVRGGGDGEKEGEERGGERD